MLFIVDDRDSSIQWSPISSLEIIPSMDGWSHSGSYTDFRHTVTTSALVGSSMSFHFYGTSVAVFANGLESTGATCEFFVDGLHAGRYIGPGGTHGNKVFSSKPLGFGYHTLEMYLSGTDEDDAGISIDYILYDSTEGATANPGHIFIDNDSQSVNYLGQWTRKYGTGISQAVSTNRTLIGASTSGSNVTIRFSGHRLEAYGALSSGASNLASVFASVVAQYSLDGVDNGVNSLELSDISYWWSNPASDSLDTVMVSSTRQLFSIQFEEDGQHTVTVTSLVPDVLYFDYFLAKSSDAPSSLETRSHTRSLSSDDSGAKYAVIIGSIIGALGLLLSIFLWNYRSKRVGNNMFEPVPFHVTNGSYSPWLPQDDGFSASIPLVVRHPPPPMLPDLSLPTPPSRAWSTRPKDLRPIRYSDFHPRSNKNQDRATSAVPPSRAPVHDSVIVIGRPQWPESDDVSICDQDKHRVGGMRPWP